MPSGKFDVVSGQAAQVDVGEARKATEHEPVADQLQRAFAERQRKQAVELVRGQVVAADELAVEPVVSERVTREHAFGTGLLEDVLECDQVNPNGVGATEGILLQIGVKSRHELVVYLPESDIHTSVTRTDVLLQVVLHAPIFIIGMDASGYSDHAQEPAVVEVEKGKQIFFRTLLSQKLLLDHRG